MKAQSVSHLTKEPGYTDLCKCHPKQVYYPNLKRIRKTQRQTQEVGEVGSPLQKITLLDKIQASDLLVHLDAVQKSQGKKMCDCATDYQMSGFSSIILSLILSPL